MNKNKIKIINAILENSDPEKAILTACAIISDFLKQQESSQQPSVDYQH